MDAPNGPVAEVLQKPQQRDLALGRERVDLVEEQRPALRLGNRAGTRLLGVGERTLAVAEQFGLDQPVGNGAAVDGDQRPGAPRAAAQNRPRRQLLAGSCFALDQDRRVAAGDLLDLLRDGAHGGGVADELQPRDLGPIADLAVAPAAKARRSGLDQIAEALLGDALNLMHWESAAASDFHERDSRIAATRLTKVRSTLSTGRGSAVRENASGHRLPLPKGGD